MLTEQRRKQEKVEKGGMNGGQHSSRPEPPIIPPRSSMVTSGTK
jgi:hypothetical protein